jgi:outer membrane lipoprotein SlyB
MRLARDLVLPLVGLLDRRVDDVESLAKRHTGTPAAVQSDMPVVSGVFVRRADALAALQALAAAGVDPEHIQWVSSPTSAGDLAREQAVELPAGAVTGLALGTLVAGPIGAIVGALFGGAIGRELAQDQVREIEGRVARGAALVLVRVPEEAADRAADILREHTADHVRTSTEEDLPRSPPIL